MQSNENRFSAFYELHQAAENFDTLVSVNFPELHHAQLTEVAAIFGRTLQRQVPAGRMSGGVNKRLVRQFRMPGFPLVLAGHYHGGQVAVPGRAGRLNPARLLTEFDGGLYEDGDATLFVSKGIGTTGPRIRLACPPEIGVVELRQ